MQNLYKFKAIITIASAFLFFLHSYSQDNLLFDQNILWIKGDSNSKAETINKNPILKLDKDLSFVNKLNEKSTFFFVFKNDSIASVNKIASLKYGHQNVEISTEGIVKNGKKVIEIETKPYGQIVSYTFHDAKVNLSSKNEMIFYKSKLKDDSFKFLEIIVLPEILSTKEIRKVETYLALKFGISLTEEQDYLGRHNDTIWNASKSEKFSHRVTGIDFNIDKGLNQKSSKNSQGDGLEIAYNFNRDAETPNDKIEYLLWGDDNETIRIEEDKRETSFVQRTWKYKYSILDEVNSDESPLVNLDFDLSSKDLESLQGHENLYLAFSDQSDAFTIDNIDAIELFEPSQIDSLSLNFKGVELQKEGYFKLLKIDDINIDFAENMICNSLSEFKFDIAGGVQPYTIQLTNLKTNAKENYNINDNVFSKTFETSGEYEIVVRDKFNQIISELFEVKDSQIIVEMSSQIEIFEGDSRLMSPSITTTIDSENLKYKWYFNEQIITETKDVRISEEGVYRLNVSTESCDCDFPLSVEYNKLDDDTNAEITLTPNPISAGENLNLNFNFTKVQNLDITLFDVNGKLILNESLQKIKTTTYQKQIENSGVYFINIKYSQKTKTFKLIVK
ncbi:T9SS type A sorting domain-containing protein [Psychroserpens luteus]|uniref:T9SS type A sorting domain-containing protein n=1 Tax=Psychroserpens luteus TaxID=1434066 RepID=A0ABW5ZQR6_9FLAO|nr:T9SS type A sorting domain-containing protein [Psychroserpens luteus]